MDGWRLDSILDVLRPHSLFFGLLWAGLAALTLALVVLMFTRLGQLHPLRKCLALSLLAHLLLAGYSTTIHLSTLSASEEEPVLRIALADPATEVVDPHAGDPAAHAPKNLTGGGEKPWDSFVETRVSEPQNVDLARADVNMRDDPLRHSAIAPGAVPPASNLEHLPLVRSTTPEPKPAQNALPPPPNAHEKAEKIEAPAAQKRDEQRPMVSFGAAPKRADTTTAASSAATRAPTAGLPTELFQLSLSPLVVPAIRGTPDPSGQIADLAERKSPATEHAPANVAAVSVAGPQPLDAAASEGDPSAGGPIRRMFAPSLPATAAKRIPPAETPADALGEVSVAALPPTALIRRNSDGYKVPDAYRLRVAPDRTQLAQRHGATTETEAAVRSALKWIAGTQAADGRWRGAENGAGRELRVAGQERIGAGMESDTGMTGLALLAMLASGQTHRDGPYKQEVRKGLEFLIGVQGADGNLGGHGTVFEFMYCHAMAAFAMSEALGMTGDPQLQEPVRRALGYSIRNQNPTSGGWRYQPGDPGDTSQLGWQFMALKSGELAGIPIPESTRAGIIRFLGSVAAGTHGGLATYRPGEQVSRTMSAEAIACWQLLGMPREHPAGRELGDYLLTELPGDGKTNVYYWYYGTLAMYQLQGMYWTRWNEALRSALVSEQIKNGPLAGSWDPDGVWGGYGGRVYSTAVSTLCLEIYYRFLPLYREVASPDTKAE
jgi:hypothetical protein